jgi:predicted phage terminase large subunit-like protein
MPRPSLDFSEDKETARDRKARLEREAAEEAASERSRREKLTLVELVQDLSPEMTWNLDHLSGWTEMWERVARGESVLGLCAVPIQSGKTELTLHAIVYTLLRHPNWRFVLFTYSFDRAKKIAKRLRELCRLAGVGPIPGWDEIKQWMNAEGGGVTAMSAEQSSLGEPCECLVFDDPLDEYGATDPRVRDDVDDAIIRYKSRAKVKGNDGIVRQGSVLGVMSRWHPDDPYGRREKRLTEEWECVTSAALLFDDNNKPYSFAETVWPVKLLLEKRATLAEKDPTEREWEAQFQNNPKRVVDSKFREDIERWTKLPEWAFRLAYGVDLAFTSDEGSDYFALVVLKIYGTKAYVIDVQRHKLDAHLIESTCRAALNKYGYAPFFTYVSGPEIGTVKILRERGIPFAPMKARYNKLVRAERTIKRWNDLKIVVPAEAPWMPNFMHRVSIFTGADKGHDDDEIDALVSVCDGAMGGQVAGTVKVLGKAYTGIATR